MSGIKGEFTGFSFGGCHSSDFGITRVSDGSRYNDNLLPTIQDKTVQAPGRDGTYFFGSYYTQRVFNVSFVFDELTEGQLKRVQAVFGDKKIHDLIFDEAPYKAYRAKVTGSATIKYIPFGQGATNRVYKGEGNIQFTAFEPYARSVYKFLNNVPPEHYVNSNEWNDSAMLKDDDDNYNYNNLNGNRINLYNPGVKDSDFILTLNFDSNGKIPAGGIKVEKDGINLGILNFNEMTKQKNDDSQIKINSSLNLIEGYKDVGGAKIKSGTIYNRYIKNGSFFKIPQSLDLLGNESNVQLIFTSSDGDEGGSLKSQFDSVDYDYYYF